MPKSQNVEFRQISLVASSSTPNLDPRALTKPMHKWRAFGSYILKVSKIKKSSKKILQVLKYSESHFTFVLLFFAAVSSILSKSENVGFRRICLVASSSTPNLDPHSKTKLMLKFRAFRRHILKVATIQKSQLLIWGLE